jgi:hypothetical protein
VTIDTLIWIMVLFLIGYAWWHNLGVRTHALAQVQQHCEETNVQLLDQTLLLKKMRPARNSRGQFNLMRIYEFEFTSTGDQRYKGNIKLVGLQVDGFDMDVYRV